ncbi:DUF3696 domain-containing protein [Sphingobium sp.]|uniref:DUF3696 domain-containing protein n=1 Tax=Sphingobium sp. TaxID=1912891 RepID=UPI0028BE76E2|nr:DUF3696 domain-containing protein [Sphingobium sp.]
MLTSMQFTNFKSWEDADIQCGRITGIFGTNSSGKTSLLQFLLLLKQTKQASDRAIALELNGDLVQLGTMRDVLHAHDESRSIEAKLTFDLEEELTLNDPSGKRTSAIASGEELTFQVEIGVNKRAPQTKSIGYTLGDTRFSLTQKGKDSTEFELQSLPLRKTSKSFSFVRTQGRPWQLPGPIKSYAFPDQARTFFQNSGFLADLEACFEEQLDNIYYLGPLREYPQRDYLWARSRPSDVGQRGEKTIDAILAATEAEDTRNIRYNARYMPFQKMIAHWLRELGLIESFSVDEIAEGSNRWQAKVKTRKGASDVLLTDVGFGVSQVLPVITLLQYVPEGSTVIFEQPEIHLHPLAQAGLADAIIQAAVHRGVQVIFESHSEHLLLRLQRRIAEEAVTSDNVRLYFCDAPKGKSQIVPLEVDALGNIGNWPDRFMGDAFTEAAEAELARLSRMKAPK